VSTCIEKNPKRERMMNKAAKKIKNQAITEDLS
jgi:hypothetical protein